jgi:hypothetical protein
LRVSPLGPASLTATPAPSGLLGALGELLQASVAARMHAVANHGSVLNIRYIRDSSVVESRG